MTSSKKRSRIIRFTFKTLKQALKFYNNSSAVEGKQKILCNKTLTVSILV